MKFKARWTRHIIVISTITALVIVVLIPTIVSVFNLFGENDHIPWGSLFFPGKPKQNILGFLPDQWQIIRIDFWHVMDIFIIWIISMQMNGMLYLLVRKADHFDPSANIVQIAFLDGKPHENQSMVSFWAFPASSNQLMFTNSWNTVLSKAGQCKFSAKMGETIVFRRCLDPRDSFPSLGINHGHVPIVELVDISHSDDKTILGEIFLRDYFLNEISKCLQIFWSTSLIMPICTASLSFMAWIKRESILGDFFLVSRLDNCSIHKQSPIACFSPFNYSKPRFPLQIPIQEKELVE